MIKLAVKSDNEKNTFHAHLQTKMEGYRRDMKNEKLSSHVINLLLTFCLTGATRAGTTGFGTG